MEGERSRKLYREGRFVERRETTHEWPHFRK